MSEAILVKDMMSKATSIAKSAAITEALDKMLDEGTDPLIVTNNGSVVGTISRKSIAEILGRKRNSAISPNQIHVSTTVEEDFTSAYPDQEIDVLIPLLQHYKIVVILDDEHRLIGQVDAGDILSVMQPACRLDEVMTAVDHILGEERVVHLRRRMLDGNNPRFIVIEDGEALGIVTETDVATAMRSFKEVVDDKYQDHRIRNLLVKDIMSAPVHTVKIDASVQDAIDLMTSRRISAVPVTEEGRIVGIVTRQSLVNEL